MNHQTSITMKYIFFPFAAMALSFVLLTCTLEQEPAIPTGETNFEGPQTFEVIEVTPDVAGGFFVKAVMDTIELNVDRYGWIWSKNPCPDLDNKIDTTQEINTQSTFGRPFPFQDTLSGVLFDKGEVYYFRPYAIAKNGAIFYGESECTCSFLGVDFDLYTDTFNITSEPEVFDSADVTFMNRSSKQGDFNYQWAVDDVEIQLLDNKKNLYFNNTETVVKTVKLKATSNNKPNCTVEKKLMVTVLENPFKDYWVEIPGNPPYEFWMGGCDTMIEYDCEILSFSIPQHKVKLTKKYFIGKTEITQRMYKAVTGNNTSKNQASPLFPVESASRQDIDSFFIPQLTKRTGRRHELPTEAEWEYAARANQQYLYSGSDTLYLVGWLADLWVGALDMCR